MRKLDDIDAQINQAIATRLLMARDAKGLTQKDLAEKSGIYVGTVGRIEAGCGLRVSTAIRLARALDLPDSYLVNTNLNLKGIRDARSVQETR